MIKAQRDTISKLVKSGVIKPPFQSLKATENTEFGDGANITMQSAKAISRSTNGVNYFHPPLCRLSLFYNKPRQGAGGDSIPLTKYIKKNLKTLASERPYIEMQVIARTGPPELRAMYNDGKEKVICLKGLAFGNIQKVVNEVCNSNGKESDKRSKRYSGIRKGGFPRVMRGESSKMEMKDHVWNPFYADQIFRP